jgi:hypothetical protein
MSSDSKEDHPLTLICCVNDSTGSITPYVVNYVDGINEFLGDQTSADNVLYNSVVFGGEVRKWTHDTFVPIRNFVKYTVENYFVGGMTAMYDAIGEGITKVDAFVDPLLESGRKVNIVFFIQTDGIENSSREYTAEAIKILIQDRQDTRGWKFIFIGANQDAIMAGRGLGVRKETSCTYSQDPVSMGAVYRAVSSNVATMIESGEGVIPDFSEAQREESYRES